MKRTLRVGTRGSQLALYQAEMVKTLIERDFPMTSVEIIKIRTTGDMVRHANPHPLETKRVFTKEIEDALLAGQVDIAVHSAKDLTVWLPEGLKLGAVIEREDPRDCLISREKKILSQLPLGARIGTSSLRRRMQLLRWSPELIVEEVHGNVDTRIRKMEEGNYDALVLALAGVKRLGLENLVTEIFPENEFYPAPGQGAIVIECRSGDPELDEILEPLHHRPSAARLLLERAFLRRLEGGCQLPCGIVSHLEHGKLSAAGVLFALEGHEWAEDRIEAAADHPEETGRELAEKIIENGGREILEKIRRSSMPRHHGTPHPLSDPPARES